MIIVSFLLKTSVDHSCLIKTHQEDCPEIEFVFELRDEDVIPDHALGDLFFDFVQNLREPLKLLLAIGHPQKQDLIT